MTAARAWMGDECDHLIVTCPALARSTTTRRNGGVPVECVGEVDPDGTDLCGWCVHVWHARAGQTNESAK